MTYGFRPGERVLHCNKEALRTRALSLPSASMRRVSILVVFLSIAVGALAGGDWTLLKVQGRDYVTLENIAEFYGLSDVRHVDNEITMKIGASSLRGTANSVEFFINGLKFNLSYPVLEENGRLCMSRMDLAKVIEPVLRPSRIKGAEAINTVVLDAGHGGHDNGAVSSYGFEKQFALDVVERARLLFAQGGYKVVLTRSSDVFIPLYDRVAIANGTRNSLFISVHFNSGGLGTGLETYTLAPRGVPSMMADGPRVSDLNECAGNICDAQNMALATATHAAFVARSKMVDRGIKRARFVVIRDLKIPGVLVEGGFLSSPYDAKWIATPSYRQLMAASIYQAVQNYRRAVGTQIGVVAAERGKATGPRVDISSQATPPAAPAPEPISGSPRAN